MLLEVKDFNLFYGEKQALKNVNMSFLENKVTALIGPSGCGKSTLLRSFNRLNELNPEVTTTGEIWYDGDNINDLNPILLRSKIGMVFQT